jgi:hypothetical protein
MLDIYALCSVYVYGIKKYLELALLWLILAETCSHSSDQLIKIT